MASKAYLKLLEEEATFPSVAAGGRPWRIFVSPSGTAVGEASSVKTKKGKRVPIDTRNLKSYVSESEAKACQE